MKTKFAISKWTGGALLAGLTLASVPAFAQDPQESVSVEVPSSSLAQPENAGGRLPITASAGLSQQMYSKLKHHDFGFKLTRAGIGVVAPYQINEDFRLDTSLQYEHDYYNWDFLNNLSPGAQAPWQDINTMTLASILNYKVDDTWTVYGGGFMRSSADSNVGFLEGFTGGGLGGFNYKVSDDLSLGAGMAIMSQIQDHAAFVPIITAKWKFAENWLLTAGLTDVATTGYGIETKWMYDEAWTFGFGLQYHKNRFRTDTHLPNSNEGVGQEKSTLLYASATWHADPKVDVTGFIGFALGGTVKTYDNSGSQTFYSKYDTAPVIGVKGSMKF